MSGVFVEPWRKQVKVTRILSALCGWLIGKSVLVELAFSPMEGYMISMRPNRGSLSPQPPEHHYRRSTGTVNTRDTYANSTLSSSSNSCKGSDASPTSGPYPSTPRRHVKYNSSCSDNHGIHPPAPEQYLTPLQQKEVCIRHLRARLRENVEKLQDRDAEVEELRVQLWRMQEDWVEEECHRVEVQLALKEARREIQQLQRVVEAVRSQLGVPAGADEGVAMGEGTGTAVHRGFRDISAQNRKLESLLLGMELSQEARSHASSPARSLTRSSTYTKLSCEALPDRDGLSGEETLDSGFVGEGSRADLETLLAEADPESPLQPLPPIPLCEQAVQTDTMLQTPSPVSEGDHMADIAGSPAPAAISCTMQLPSPESAIKLQLETQQRESEPRPQEVTTVKVVEDEEEEDEEEAMGAARRPPNSYWGRHFLVDLLAVGIPIVPAVAWLCRGPRRVGHPVCNIGSLLRGCCALAMHSLRRVGGAGGGARGRVTQI
ncbi:syntaphilin-like isoform X2 [Paramormyrops kingsleyae]|uniref:syntaphilin-like isoform X2 n=1 Tax=Paramormyrops kingsleyae TaxID=1676925 RepID=UPI003B9732B9